MVAASAHRVALLNSASSRSRSPRGVQVGGERREQQVDRRQEQQQHLGDAAHRGVRAHVGARDVEADHPQVGPEQRLREQRGGRARETRIEAPPAPARGRRARRRIPGRRAPQPARRTARPAATRARRPSRPRRRRRRTRTAARRARSTPAAGRSSTPTASAPSPSGRGSRPGRRWRLRPPGSRRRRPRSRAWPTASATAAIDCCRGHADRRRRCGAAIDQAAQRGHVAGATADRDVTYGATGPCRTAAGGGDERDLHGDGDEAQARRGRGADPSAPGRRTRRRRPPPARGCSAPCPTAVCVRRSDPAPLHVRSLSHAPAVCPVHRVERTSHECSDRSLTVRAVPGFCNVLGGGLASAAHRSGRAMVARGAALLTNHPLTGPRASSLRAGTVEDYSR